jgi:proline iminopeptidase
MDPSHMEWMAKQLPNGHYLYCDKGSHMAIYDDQVTYMTGIIEFLRSTDATGLH